LTQRRPRRPRDLELIRTAGIKGLEPVFERLENTEYEPDEVSLDILLGMGETHDGG